MREPLKDKSRLEHILGAIDTILEKSNGLTYENLTSDKILFGGIVYYTMVIGEAAYCLSKALKKGITKLTGLALPKCAIIWFMAIIKLTLM